MKKKKKRSKLYSPETVSFPQPPSKVRVSFLKIIEIR